MMTVRLKTYIATIALFISALALHTVALAQEVQPKKEAAFEYRPAPADIIADDKKAEVKSPHQFKANAQFGLSLATGNAQSFGLNGTGVGGWKYYNNSLELLAQAAYVRIGTFDVPGGPVTGHKTATELWLWRLRYDRFFLDKNSLYASFGMDGNRPGGINYRLEPQVGYARILLQTDTHLLRGELGYNYNYEHYTDGSNPVDAHFHSIRAFTGWEWKISKWAAFTEGLEFLLAVNQIERFRLNSLSSLSATITEKISLKLNFTLKYNNQPPFRPAPNPIGSRFQKLDTVLEAALAVTFL